MLEWWEQKYQEGRKFPVVWQSYLDDKSLNNAVSQSEAIKVGYQVMFNSRKESALLIEDQQGRVGNYP